MLTVQNTHVLDSTGSMIFGDEGPFPPDRAAQLRKSLHEELASAAASAQDALSEDAERPLHDVLLAKSLFSGANGRDVLALARSLEVPYGVELERVNTRWQGWANPFAGSDAGPEGGFQPLVERVLDNAKRHGAAVRLSTLVERVHKLEDGVAVSFGAETVRARSAVVTIPLGVLKLSAPTLFDPPLPKRQLAAIERTHVGILEKLALAYPSAWWPSAADCGSFTFLPRTRVKPSSGDAADGVRVALNSSTIVVASFAAPTLPRTHPTLLFYLSPTPAGALAEHTDAAVAAGAHAFLCERFGVAPATVPAHQASVRTAWAQDPLALGATSTPPVLGAGGPFDFAELARSAWSGVLGFAGEHTDMDNRGSVAGAVISGHREADRVQRMLRRMKETT
jgi:monoamine oxidase